MARTDLKSFSVGSDVVARMQKHPDINLSRFVTDCLYTLCEVLERDNSYAHEYRLAYSKNPPAQRLHDLILTDRRKPLPRRNKYGRLIA